MPAAAPHVKRGNRILVVVGIVGGLLFVGFVALFAFAASSPQVQRLMHIASESQRLTKEGENAPGAAEVKAAGACQVVSVQDLSDVAALGREVQDGGSSAEDAKLTGKVIVCIVPALSDSPTCDALANAYVDAVHPDSQFYVSVTKLGHKADCTQGYSPLGDRLVTKKKK